MHYYKRNIGDYAKKAGRLSMLQHGAYTLLLDACYDREKFPTLRDAIDWTWASTPEEIDAVKFVLSKFFSLQDGFYVQNHVKEELDQYNLVSETNSRIARERETKRKENSTKRARVVNEAPPNQEPLTNKEPLAPDGACQLRCPAGHIVDAYHELMPDNPRVKLLTDARKKSIAARWREAAKLGVKPFGYDTVRDGLEAWRTFFEVCAESKFLTGRAAPSPGRPIFFADIDFLFSPKGFIKALENKYHGDTD